MHAIDRFLLAIQTQKREVSEGVVCVCVGGCSFVIKNTGTLQEINEVVLSIPIHLHVASCVGVMQVQIRDF